MFHKMSSVQHRQRQVTPAQLGTAGVWSRPRRYMSRVHERVARSAEELAVLIEGELLHACRSVLGRHAVVAPASRDA